MKNIKGKTISIILCLALVFGSTLNVFATAPNQETLYPYLRNSYGTSFFRYNGTSTSITSRLGIGDMFAYLGYNVSETLYYIYNAVDNLETKLDTISGKIKDYSTVLSNISGYIDGVEGYIDGLETALTTSNSRLNSILTSLQNINTYNYTSVLNSILANTNYLGSIESHLDVVKSTLGTSNNNGIWGSAYSSAVSLGQIQPDINSIESIFNNRFDTFNLNNLSPYYITGFSNSSGTSPVYTWFSDRGKAYASYFSSGNLPFINFRSSNNTASAYTIDSTHPTSLLDYLYLLDSNSVQIATMLFSPRSYYYNVEPDYVNGSSKYRNLTRIYSISDFLSSINDNTSDFFGRIGFVIADPDTIARKKDNASKTGQVLDDFASSNGSASASVSDFTGAKDSVTSVKNGLATGTNISNILNIYNSDDGYNFFSQTVANDINGVSSSTNSTRYKSNSDDTYYTPLLDEKMNALYSVMGVLNGK